jgi:hypothetical protein
MDLEEEGGGGSEGTLRNSRALPKFCVVIRSLLPHPFPSPTEPLFPLTCTEALAISVLTCGTDPRTPL